MTKLNKLRKNLNVNTMTKKEAIKRCLEYIIYSADEANHYEVSCEEENRHPADYEGNAKYHIYAAAMIAYNSPKELLEIKKRDYDEENLKEHGLL